MTTRNWPPLTDSQGEVLRWIRDGADEANPPTETYKTTAVALAARDLINLDRRKGRWKATLTAGGAFYLEHGHFKGRPPVTRVRRTEPSTTDPAKAGSAKADKASTARFKERLESIAARDAEPERLVVATELRGLHPAVRAVVEAKLPEGMPSEHRRRAHLLLHTLAKEAQRRGWTIARPGERGADLITIDAGDRAVPIRIRLRTRRVDHVKSARELASEARPGHSWAPKHDYLTTDDLIVTVGGADYRDTARFKLQDKLLSIIERIEAASAEARVRAEERRVREEDRARQREQAAQRRKLAEQYAAWVSSLKRFEADWSAHARSANFLRALAAQVEAVEDPARQAELRRFSDWAEGHLGRTTPLITHRFPAGDPPSRGSEEWRAGAHEDQPPDWSWMLPRRE